LICEFEQQLLTIMRDCDSDLKQLQFFNRTYLQVIHLQKKRKKGTASTFQLSVYDAFLQTSPQKIFRECRIYDRCPPY
jgi:hypothetical protein